ncbi:MAG: hypothetical protein PHY25_03390, partial [Dehalococcoidales bacterium]|nr:hypothetical protein [Dehalococcoidales bacterium]
MNNEQRLIDEIGKLKREVERLKRVEQVDSSLIGRPVFLTTPLTSTSWDGDAFSTTSKTLIDLSTVFGAPAGIKAVLCNVAIKDSASAANDCFL